tara:strand:+ start:96 stop:440 length:345 start_codon:yes stop_codon:yes gene_type:complete
MYNKINKKNSEEETPTVGNEWKRLYEKDRIDKIEQLTKTNNAYDEFNVVGADENGQVTLRIEKSIPAGERGVTLLDFEDLLKSNIDKAITVWLEPIGDKSKLRNLRGIKFKSEI